MVGGLVLIGLIFYYRFKYDSEVLLTGLMGKTDYI